MKPWHKLPANFTPAYCTWEKKSPLTGCHRRYSTYPPFDAVECLTPLYTDRQVLSFAQYAVDKHAAQDGQEPASPIDRLKRATKEFELALNEVATVNHVYVNVIDITRMGDIEHRYAYSIEIENTTTERVYP